MDLMQQISQLCCLPQDLIKYSLIPFIWDPLDGLLEASMNGSIPDAILFLDLGADVNESPLILIYAAFGGHLEYIKFLLTRGAKFQDIGNKDRFILITNGGHYFGSKQLLFSTVSRADTSYDESSSKESQYNLPVRVNDAIHAAAFGGHMDTLQFLENLDSKFVQNQKELNLLSCCGFSLQLATFGNQLHMAKYLVSKLENYETEYSCNPLRDAFAVAIHHKQKQFIDFYIECGADINNNLYIKNIIHDNDLLQILINYHKFDFRQALSVAIQTKKMDVVELVLERFKELSQYGLPPSLVANYNTTASMVQIADAYCEDDQQMAQIIDIMLDLDCILKDYEIGILMMRAANFDDLDLLVRLVQKYNIQHEYFAADYDMDDYLTL